MITDHSVAEHTADNHQHGAGCGHETILHDGHVDYLHDGHLHHEHDGHYDEHGEAP
ncbi:zinc transporter permease [Actinoplanes sp. OR16]|uniref:zinc transporter permease n=1 Tax=Actinoplanes sp. OR16 TaxID=946334 RepID=UPI000FDA3E81|nr:zinc transporter permease [Actinoplanes sp. OR16]